MKTVLILLTIALGAHAAQMQTTLGVQSAILPGMGQVAAGEGKITDLNTVKGLGIMAGFVFSLNGLVGSLSAYDSYSEETRTLQREYDNAAFKSDKDRLYAKWDAAYQNSQDAKISLAVFSLLTVAVYGYGVTDALLFTKVKEKKGAGPSSRLDGRTRLELSSADGRQGLMIRHRF